MGEARVNPLDWHEPDMLVVDTPHVRLVRNVLQRFIKDEKRDYRLGLSLLILTSADKAADAVLDWPPGELRQQPERRKSTPSGWTGVDRLLENLRAVFRDAYGWTPIMGKNRLMTPVEAVTYPNVGQPGTAAAGGPEPIPYARLEQAEELRKQNRGRGKGVRVGLPDTVLYAHPTLAGTYVVPNPRRDQILPGPEKYQTDWRRKGLPYIAGHSCQLASLILREAPAARLDVRPVLRTAASAKWNPGLSVWQVARKMVDYLDSGVQIINCSWACLTKDGEAPLVLERAMGMLTPTIMVVAAASNHGKLITVKDDYDPWGADRARRKNRLPDRFAPAFPAALPNVVAVGALNGNRLARFNPRVRAGNELAPWIDVLAPGVDTIGAYFGFPSESEPVDVPVTPKKGEVVFEERLEQKRFTGAARWTGTSFAAATVTGAIAARIKAGTSAYEALTQLLDGGGPIRPAQTYLG